MQAAYIDSNEAEVIAIFEALRIFFSSFSTKLVVESDSMNTISWISSSKSTPWRFHFYFNEIKVLSSSISVKFQHVGKSVNGFADSLAKLRVDSSAHFVVCSL